MLFTNLSIGVLIEKYLERTALKMLSFIKPGCFGNADNRCGFLFELRMYFATGNSLTGRKIH